jgi:hypothetical protein
MKKYVNDYLSFFNEGKKNDKKDTSFKMKRAYTNFGYNDTNKSNVLEGIVNYDCIKDGVKTFPIFLFTYNDKTKKILKVTPFNQYAEECMECINDVKVELQKELDSGK